jgi:hypothetical protein
MIRKTTPVLAAASMLLFGCADYTEKYAQYEGQQRNWPVSMGATVDTQEAVPVYYGPPPRFYSVLGQLAAKSDGNTLRELAKSAKAKGADAIIFGDSKVVNEGYAAISNGSVWGNYNGYAYGNATTTSVPLDATVVGAILIKWK